MGYLNYAQFGCGHQLKFPWNKITGSQWFHLMFDWCWSSNAGYTYRNNAEVLLLFLLTRSRFTWMACFQVDPYLTTWSKSDEGESTKWCECKTWPESSVPKQNALTTTRPRSGIQVLGIQGLEKFNIARNHLACHWLTGVGYISLYGTLNALHIAPPPHNSLFLLNADFTVTVCSKPYSSEWSTMGGSVSILHLRVRLVFILN